MPKLGASDEPTEKGGSTERQHVFPRHGGPGAPGLGHATRRRPLSMIPDSPLLFQQWHASS